MVRYFCLTIYELGKSGDPFECKYQKGVRRCAATVISLRVLKRLSPITSVPLYSGLSSSQGNSPKDNHINSDPLKERFFVLFKREDGEHMVSRRSFVKMFAVLPTACGWTLCSCSKPNNPHIFQDDSNVILKDTDYKECEILADTAKFLEVREDVESITHFELLKSSGHDAEIKDTSLGPMIVSIDGVYGDWCCLVGNEFSSGSGNSRLCRIGSVKISSSQDALIIARSFKRGTLGILFDNGLPSAGCQDACRGFGVFSEILVPQDVSIPNYSVVWFLSREFRMLP